MFAGLSGIQNPAIFTIHASLMIVLTINYGNDTTPHLYKHLAFAVITPNGQAHFLNPTMHEMNTV